MTPLYTFRFLLDTPTISIFEEAKALDLANIITYSNLLYTLSKQHSVNIEQSMKIYLEAQKTSGCIINISSDSGLKAYQGFNADAYSASKAGLIILNC